MASSQDIVCNCKNTCTCITKRGSCPCRAAGILCSDLCTCGWMVPCINKQECQPPMLIDVDMYDSAEREVLQFARENLLDSEDWQPQERCGMPPPSTNRKTSRGKKRLDMDNEMEVDADTRHTTPLVHNSSQKRKKKGATAARVRRRLEVRVQTDMLLESEDEEQMVQTTSRRRIVRPRSTPHQAVGAPDGPPIVTSHHQAVKDFAANLSMTQLQTIVTELLFRDQASFEDYLHGYRPCDNPPSQPQPEDLPRWCRCGNCRPMPSAQENKCCWQTCSSQCVVNSPNFYTVVTPAILDLAMAHYNDPLHIAIKLTDSSYSRDLDDWAWVLDVLCHPVSYWPSG